MEENPKDIILKILDIIGYTGDKDAVANKFLVTCQQQANVDLIQALSSEKQEELKQKLSEPGISEDVKKTQEVIQNYFSQQEYMEALEKASGTVFSAYMDQIVKDLSEEKQAQLTSYFQTLAPQQ